MGEPRRILLVEVTPKVPQAPVFATWNPADKGPNITRSGGHLTAANAAAAYQNARSTIGLSAGRWYWEIRYGGSGADAAGGIATAAMPLTTRLGFDNVAPWKSIGGPYRSGTQPLVVMGAGTVMVFNGDFPAGTVIRHLLDLDARTYSIAVAGGTWQSVGISALGNGPFYPAAAVANNNTVTANFGASAFAYPVPDGANAGVYSTPAAVPTTFYLGSEGFNTGAGDVPASTHYMGRIAGDQDVEIAREGGCWVWGNQSSARRGQVVLVNADGGLDAWIGFDWRDAPIKLWSGYEGQTRAEFDLWSSGFVDTIEFTADLRVRLALADPLALLDKAIQPATYPDTTPNAQAIGRPIPIVIGRPLYCTPVRLDTSPAVRNYQVHDDWIGAGQNRYLTSIDAVFDRGDRFAGPNDPYSPHSPITLANGGNFTTWSNDTSGIPMPQNFARVTGFTATDRFQPGVTAGTLRCISSGQMAAAIYHTPSSLLAGYRYVISFDATTVTKPGTIIFRADGSAPDLPFDDAVISITTTGAKTVTIDVTEQAQPQIVIGRQEMDVTIDNLKIDSVQIIDWTYWSGATAKMGFTLTNAPAGKIVCNPVGQFNANVGKTVEWLNLVIAQVCSRAGQGGVGASALALMGRADYRIASYIDSAKTALQVLREIMDGWCGWVVPFRVGQIEVGRVEEPANTAVLTLDETNVIADIEVTTDTAKGLTIVLGGRRNHSPHTDSDIATSVSAAMRAELTAELTCIRTGAPALTSAPVSSAYTAAIGAPPKATLLQEPADIQAEANRVATLWRPRRMFYSVTAVLGASAADVLEPGQTVRLVWPRYGLSGGKNLLVIGVTSRFFSRRVDLKLWG